MARFGRKDKTDDTQTYGETVAEDYETHGDPFASYENDPTPDVSPVEYNPTNEFGPELHDVYPEDNPVTSNVFDFASMSFDDADALPPRTRKTAANPFTAVVAESLATGKTKRTPPLAPDQVKDVTGLLRRAATDAGHGIEIREGENAIGEVTLYFKSNSEKRARAYTVVMVREWAATQGYPESDLLPRVAPHVSNAYREAHGHKVNKK